MLKVKYWEIIMTGYPDRNQRAQYMNNQFHESPMTNKIERRLIMGKPIFAFLRSEGGDRYAWLSLRVKECWINT
ncbi:hypothetical protein ACFLV6_02410 [Chloroflexota bacterium]